MTVGQCSTTRRSWDRNTKNCCSPCSRYNPVSSPSRTSSSPTRISDKYALNYWKYLSNPKAIMDEIINEKKKQAEDLHVNILNEPMFNKYVQDLVELETLKLKAKCAGLWGDQWSRSVIILIIGIWLDCTVDWIMIRTWRTAQALPWTLSSLPSPQCCTAQADRTPQTDYCPDFLPPQSCWFSLRRYIQRTPSILLWWTYRQSKSIGRSDCPFGSCWVMVWPRCRLLCGWRREEWGRVDRLAFLLRSHIGWFGRGEWFLFLRPPYRCGPLFAYGLNHFYDRDFLTVLLFGPVTFQGSWTCRRAKWP